ncbi:ThuA domain-containing protein [Nocardioides flavescens]|uniref:Ig-like domain (Group 3) n=1 Tax=Nocardioides flavescens TaxID=2691959 RepID=A0A6L7F0X6_9ACTN|nr:ThuA domain-containing protein [Nocardioides flavescens]MXG90301.1 hypothetical protein [Nocardioides flavescens]
MSTTSGATRRRAGRTALVGAGLSGAVAISMIVTTAGPASAADSGAPPTLSDVRRSPVSPVPAYNGILANTTWTPSTATGLRDWFTDPKVTLTFSATDDTDVAKFVVTPGTGATPVEVPATAAGGTWTGSYELTAEQSTTVTYTAVDTAGNASPAKTTLVKIDRTPPSVTWPGVVGGKIAHSATYASVRPALTDVTTAGGTSFNGSGGPAIRLQWVDGKPTDLVPLDVASLPVGAHTWAIVVGDAAGNQAKHTLSFEVTTSYADVKALVARFVTEGRISAANGADLTGLVDTAASAAGLGSTQAAVAALEDFAARAKQYAPRGVARQSLTGDAAHLLATLGGRADQPVATGVTVEAYGPAQRMPQVYAGPSVVNPDPDFKVLVFANRVGGFRHQHIPATMKFIQEQGQRLNFDVDVWDYMAPAESVPGNPFESLANLEQYDALVAVSSVGNSQFTTNRPTFDPTDDPSVTVDEQAILKQYVNNGGGFVAIHGATDSMHGWDWYKELVGGEFDNHSSSNNGTQHNCEACRWTEVVTEDGTNPSTDHFPRSIRVLDELYNWVALPREKVHVLQTLTEASYVGGLNSADGRTEGADHPISWCRNFDGGRSYTQALMHNYELSEDPRFQEQILQAIRWTAGETEANCVTHGEVQGLVTAQQTGGGVPAQVATAVNAQVTGSYTAYLAKDYATALTRAQEAARLLENGSAGSAAALGVLRPKAAELVAWMRMLDTTSPRLRFLAEPQDAVTTVGSDAVFSVEAAGTDVTYQWQRQAPGGAWGDVAGETTVALRVVPNGLGQDGTRYRVQIADAGTELYSRPAALTVTTAQTAVSVQQPAVATYGVAGEVVAKVSSASGAASGAVSLFEGSTLLGTVQAVDGTARLALPATLAVGSHALTVRYAGGDGVAAAQAATTVTVKKATPSVSAKASKKKVRKGAKVKVTVAVSATGFVPTGTVRLYDGKKAVGGTATLENGAWTFTFEAKKVGKHKLSVRYAGSATTEEATSATVVVKVRKK